MSAPAPRALLRAVDALLLVGLALLSPLLLVRVALRDRWRRGLSERLTLRLPPPRGERRRIWVHGASAGEMTAVTALVDAWRSAEPEADFVLSSTTTAGVDVARRRAADLPCFVLPIDVSWCVSRALGRVDPEVLVLVELELWPNLVHAAADRGVTVAVANGRVGERSARRLGRPWVRRLLGVERVAAWAVQNDEIAARVRSLEVPEERVAVTGNLKVEVRRDGAPTRDEVRRRLRFGAADRVVVAGSTHPGEEARIGRAVAALAGDPGPPVRLLVAPRHGERLADAERKLQDAGLAPVRLTRLRREEGPPATTIVVDTMGELADLYAAADLAIVGGSLVAGIGGHNVFEPVLAGAPTLIGAHHGNVRSDVLWLEAAGALRVVRDDDALLPALREWLGEGGPAAADAARRALDGARGAAERTIRWIRDHRSRRAEPPVDG
ncbi:MAG: 3-deoxy-D-manno-octulosonic acid transferase [Planctomycetota bacterium JB042]